MKTFVDIAVSQGEDGFFDIELDTVNRDAAKETGLASAFLVSLFTDRRAAADEVANPINRRGWIGDTITDLPGDRIGSGLWLYQQRRQLPVTSSGLEAEARNALQWLIDDGLANSVFAQATRNDRARRTTLMSTVSLVTGGVSEHAFELADQTRSAALIGN